jgi:hypothetical protein
VASSTACASFGCMLTRAEGKDVHATKMERLGVQRYQGSVLVNGDVSLQVAGELAEHLQWSPWSPAVHPYRHRTPAESLAVTLTRLPASGLWVDSTTPGNDLGLDLEAVASYKKTRCIFHPRQLGLNRNASQKRKVHFSTSYDRSQTEKSNQCQSAHVIRLRP